MRRIGSKLQSGSEEEDIGSIEKIVAVKKSMLHSCIRPHFVGDNAAAEDVVTWTGVNALPWI